MLGEADYDRDALDVIVVDNASDDGASEMVKEEFPEVQLIRREENCGVSGWNDGFAVARGDYVLALDDDCYLPEDGLRRAVEQAQEHDADLVSFAVRALDDPDYRFNERYRTGLLTFWGCAVLIRRPVLERLGGYDPEIFVWANEMEFMLRFFDRGLQASARSRHRGRAHEDHRGKLEGLHRGALVPDQPQALCLHRGKAVPVAGRGRGPDRLDRRKSPRRGQASIGRRCGPSPNV